MNQSAARARLATAIPSINARRPGMYVPATAMPLVAMRRSSTRMASRSSRSRGCFGVSLAGPISANNSGRTDVTASHQPSRRAAAGCLGTTKTSAGSSAAAQGV